jgi:uncharacterized DUF497 family protein
MTSLGAWDPEKAKANQKNHEGVTFEEAKVVFEDANAITITDYESDPNEERLITIGMGAKARVLVVVYTYRREKIRIISARKANPRERKEYSEQ